MKNNQKRARRRRAYQGIQGIVDQEPKETQLVFTTDVKTQLFKNKFIKD